MANNQWQDDKTGNLRWSYATAKAIRVKIHVEILVFEMRSRK